MASKIFHINTTPHEAIVGEHTFLFQPEANGARFATAFEGLRGAQVAVAGVKEEDLSGKDLQAVSAAMKTFLATFLMPESAALFSSVELPDRVLTGLVEFLAEVYGSGTAGNDEKSTS